MNRFGLVLLAAFTLATQTSVFAQGPMSPKPKIRWTESIQTAMKQQKVTGRPLLIYVTAGYCGYCRKMERETWSDPKVARRIQDELTT